MRCPPSNDLSSSAVGITDGILSRRAPGIFAVFGEALRVFFTGRPPSARGVRGSKSALIDTPQMLADF